MVDQFIIETENGDTLIREFDPYPRTSSSLYLHLLHNREANIFPHFYSQIITPYASNGVNIHLHKRTDVIPNCHSNIRIHKAHRKFVEAYPHLHLI
ncbi:hypothetical protein Scep_026461 [Stephania cephalantha]|uniref:Uncharacterized protein n=1 Tax=Stephania cephalantha TaxID=152367 RepID=A0AAP0HS31_9MAGN